MYLWTRKNFLNFGSHPLQRISRKNYRVIMKILSLDKEVPVKIWNPHPDSQYRLWTQTRFTLEVCALRVLVIFCPTVSGIISCVRHDACVSILPTTVCEKLIHWKLIKNTAILTDIAFVTALVATQVYAV